MCCVGEQLTALRSQLQAAWEKARVEGFVASKDKRKWKVTWTIASVEHTASVSARCFESAEANGDDSDEGPRLAERARGGGNGGGRARDSESERSDDEEDDHGSDSEAELAARRDGPSDDEAVGGGGGGGGGGGPGGGGGAAADADANLDLLNVSWKSGKERIEWSEVAGIEVDSRREERRLYILKHNVQCHSC